MLLLHHNPEKWCPHVDSHHDPPASRAGVHILLHLGGNGIRGRTCTGYARLEGPAARSSFAFTDKTFAAEGWKHGVDARRQTLTPPNPVLRGDDRRASAEARAFCK